MTMFGPGDSVDLPSALRLFFQRRLAARTARMMASLLPMVDVPTASSSSLSRGAWNSLEIMETHRWSKVSMLGYSSPSMKFIFEAAAMSSSLCTGGVRTSSGEGETEGRTRRGRERGRTPRAPCRS